MKYMHNWEKTRTRFNALWKHELIDRCCVSITSQKCSERYNVKSAPQNPEDRAKYWTDGEWISNRYKKKFENTYFAGDAFPVIPICLGTAGCAGFFKNARYEFAKSTIWFIPYINDYCPGSIVFDAESTLYEKTIDVLKYLSSESKGDYIIGMPDLSGAADALAHMRGSENFLIDIIDNPGNVRKALKKIEQVRLETSKKAFEIVKNNNYGGSSVGWLNTWGMGHHDQMQCDLSVMISPDIFKEFIVPELERQTNSFDIPLYHFDGIEQIRHLDMLLSLDKLAAIQWTWVAGQPAPTNFIPELKRIQKAGKVLVLGITPNEVETIMEQLSSRGLFLIISTSTEEEAKEIEQTVTKLTHE